MKMKILFIVLIFTLIIFIGGCDKEPAIKFIEKEINLYVEETYEIFPILKNKEQIVEWSSSDEEVATVVNGEVTAFTVGQVVITAKCGDYEATLIVNVNPIPEIIIEGEKVVEEGKTITLTAKIQNGEGPIEWKSDNEEVATVVDGVITGISKGKVKIYAYYLYFESYIEIKVVQAHGELIYDFDGGTSVELYESSGSIASMVLTSYNNNSGAFWDGGYKENIYISTRNADPGATFSDRIYIGKNEYTGYYEVKQILTAGTSKWIDGAEYVITISTSYSGFRSEHSKTQALSVGDIAIIKTKDITKIKQGNTATIKFFNPKIKDDTLKILRSNYNGKLITPVKLGNEFLGWYDIEGNKVEELSDVIGTVALTAKWNELNPVTEIVINDIPLELETNELFQIEASVSPSDAFFKEILYTTSNKDIINVSDNGLLTAVNAGKATITVSDYVGKIIKTYEITVNSIPSIDITFKDEYNGVLNVGEKVQLEPTFVGKVDGEVSYTYTVNDPSIASVSSTGEIVALKSGEAEINVTAAANSQTYELKVGVTVVGLSETEKVDQVLKLLADANFSVVDTGNACLYNDGTNRYYVATYGSVNRFLFDDLVIDYKYKDKALATGAHSGKRDSMGIQFVTVHDTATLSNTSEAIASNMSSGNVSIHYVVGNDQVWGVLPEEYIAWHAGDGTGVSFQWLASGVSGVEGIQPEFDMVKDGSNWYFTINGEKTKVVCPVSNGNRSIASPSKAHFSYLGPTWTVQNGEYYIGTPWVSFGQNASGVISSHGGNNNSVGIEMCVNTGGDIYDSYQRNAKLVADILIRNNLDLTRVKQHNTFDGKNCPQVLLAGNYWWEFMEMVEINYILQKDYGDVEILFKSNDESIVDNTGRIVNAPLTTTTVSYEITVKVGSTSKTIKLYSVVPGTTTWEQWKGTYSSSLIWNKGNFKK